MFRWFLWIFIFNVESGGVSPAYLDQYETLSECMESRARVEHGMRSAYPDDKTSQYVCWPTEVPNEKDAAVESPTPSRLRSSS